MARFAVPAALCTALHLIALPAITEDSAAPDVEMARVIGGLQQAALSDRTSTELLRSLTAEVGPRFAGTPGDAAAVEWALAAMRDLGLANVRAEPVAVPRWVRGVARARIVSQHPQRLELLALGGSIGTPADGLTADVVEISSLEKLEALPDDALENKIAFINQRMERARDGSGYSKTVRIRSRGAVEAARKGAVAVLIRSVGTGTSRFPHTGGTRYEDGVRRIPAAALAIPDADVLETRLGAGEPVRIHLVLGCRRLEDGVSANVIGEVAGRERPEEIVLIGAHLDSWDVGQGAVDDGAGCATVLAAARLLASLPQRPRRTIRVVLFANEEFGLSGARAYAKQYANALERHQLAVESDFGAGRIWRFASRVHPLDIPTVAAFAPLLEPLGIEWFENTAWGGADLRPAKDRGVPVADLTPDGTYYFDYHHTEDDTFDKVVPEDLAQNVAAMASLAYFAAETPVALRRLPTGENS